jgi:hsp70-interacting protein
MSVNPIDEMKKCINVCTDVNESADKRLEALETLRDWCEDMNFAIDFHKINNYSLVFLLLKDKNDEIRALTCDLIATLAQNNPYCQESLTKAGILELMLQKLDQHDEAHEVKIKALYAISCLTRDFEEGQKLLLTGNGLEILVKALRSPIEKLQIKCCFLCSSICNNQLIKNKLTQIHLIETLVDMYRQTESNIHEHILAAINILIDDNPPAIKQAKEMKEINFKQILQQRIQLINGDPRHDVRKL